MLLAALATVLLLAFPASAAPPWANTTTHLLTKRDNVCSIDFRGSVNFNSCKPKNVAYIKVGPTTIRRVNYDDFVDQNAANKDTVQCDHVVEIHLLDAIVKSTGLCDLMNAAAKVEPVHLSKAKLLQDADDHISAEENLNFLEKSVNNRKKSLIDRALKANQRHSTDDLDIAVGNYLHHKGVQADSERVAAALASDLKAIVKTIQQVHDNLPKGSDKKARLKAALDQYNPGEDTIADKWSTVLARVP